MGDGREEKQSRAEQVEELKEWEVGLRDDEDVLLS